MTELDLTTCFITPGLVSTNLVPPFQAALVAMGPESKSLGERMQTARDRAAEGYMIVQNLVGGYMYLRSLIGPADLLYMFHDDPQLIHECMEAWFALADAVIARHQEQVTLDELFLAEDICFNSGPLISPDMMREFLFPYYRQLIDNVEDRQIDRTRHLYIQIDTDGFAAPATAERAKKMVHRNGPVLFPR